MKVIWNYNEIKLFQNNDKLKWPFYVKGFPKRFPVISLKPWLLIDWVQFGPRQQSETVTLFHRIFTRSFRQNCISRTAWPQSRQNKHNIFVKIRHIKRICPIKFKLPSFTTLHIQLKIDLIQCENTLVVLWVSSVCNEYGRKEDLIYCHWHGTLTMFSYLPTAFTWADYDVTRPSLDEQSRLNFAVINN